LVGFGGTARQAAARLSALGMHICAADPFLPPSHPAWQTTERLELGELFATCDVISLHVPLSAETRHLVRQETLNLMKPSAVLINAARGGVVDEAALADALRAGKIAGAALDVFEREPLDAAHGELFEGIETLLLTPHIAGVTAQSNVRVSSMIADIVLRDLKLGQAE
jgi:(S)-sulfolactate dehydrogenase